MLSYLLLLSGASGLAVWVGSISVADGPAELELSRLTVGRVSVNDELGGVLALSAKQGGTASLQLLFREFGRNFPIARLEVQTGALLASVTGQSSELLFGLEVFLYLARQDRLTGLQGQAFAATGTLDVEGNVGSVEGVPAKISAAIDSDLVAGSLVFYPRANDDEVTPDLRQRCMARGLVLKPVDQLEEALIALGVTINGRWVDTPYRSLEAFERQHSRIFFGRQSEIRQLVEQLETRASASRPGALIIGGSGSGKSSFCMAGVLPALERLSPTLEHAVWRPCDAIPTSRGETTTEADIARSVLANWRLRDVENGAGFSLAATLPDTSSLAELVAALPEDQLATRRHVWIIDQFEELFTLGFSTEAQIAFARFLSDLQARGVWVIATLRNEFFYRYQDLHDGNIAVLTEVFGREGQFDLARMGRDALRQVIVLPAELAGLKFETRVRDNTRLDDVILAHAMAIADVLPLLEFTLQLLYDGLARSDSQEDAPTEQPRLLTFAAYEAIGGIEGAISKIVEPTFAALDAETKKALPGLLDALAVPAADGQRETARPAAINQWPPDSAERNLIDALVGIRVLVSDDAGHPGVGAQVRVAHEALFTHWPEAAAILKGSRQTRLIMEDFRQRAEAWDKDGRPDGALLTSQRDIVNARAILLHANKSPDLTKLNAFITASIKAAERESAKRVRRVTLFIFTLILAAIVLAGLAWWALGQRSFALEQSSRAIAQLAEQTIERGDAMTGILLALTQLQGDDESLWSVDAQVALQHGLQTNHESAVFIGHADHVIAAAFSPNGQEIVTASADNTARLWRLDGRRWASVILSGHTGRVNSAAFSPDGQRIVSSSNDNTARVWTLVSGLWTSVELRGHTGSVNGAAFSQDGQRIVSSSNDNTARVWSFAGNQWTSVELRGHTNLVNSAVFSLDGQQIVTASWDGTARVWTLAGSRWSSVELRGHTNFVDEAAFSPDGRRIVTASRDGTVRVWTRAADGWTSVELLGHTSLVSGAKFSPDGQRIVTASWDGSARVWTLAGNRWSSIELRGHSDKLYSATFSPDGLRIITTSRDNTARLWMLVGNRWTSLELRGHTDGVNSASFSPDGQKVVTASDDNTSRMWTLASSRWTSLELRGHSGSVNDAAYSPSGKRIITASDDRTARVWTLAANRWTPFALRGHIGAVRSAAFSPDEQRIVTVSEDNTTRVWTLASGLGTSVELGGRTNFAVDAAFSPDGRRIATTSDDNAAEIWTRNGNVWTSVKLRGHASSVRSAAFSPSGQQILTVAWDDTARVWTLEGNRWTSAELSGSVSSAAFSPDELWIVTTSGSAPGRRRNKERILTASRQNAVQIWTLDGGHWMPTKLRGPPGLTLSAKFSPDGQQLVTLSDKGPPRVWTLANDGWTSVELRGHTYAVNSAAFSPDGRWIVTASNDNTARVWTLAGNRWISFELLGHTAGVNNAAFSPDGQWIVTASNDNTARVWPLVFGKALRDQGMALRSRCLSDAQLSSIGLPSHNSEQSSPLTLPPC